MKIQFSNKYVKWGTTIVIVFCTCLLFYYTLFHVEKIKTFLESLYGIFMPILFGAIMAYLLTPTLNWIEKSILTPVMRRLNILNMKKTKGIMRALSIIITSLLYYLIIQIIISMLLSQIIPSLQNLISNYDTYVYNFTSWLDDLISKYPQFEVYATNIIDKYSTELTTFIYDTVLSKTNDLIKTVSLSVISILKVLWNFVLGFIIAIYLLASKEKFSNQSKKIVYAVFKRDKANVLLNNFRFAHNTFIGFIIGKVIDSIIIGLLCFTGTSLLQTPYAALVSVVVGVTNIIPFFGPFIGAIPSAILVLVVDPTHPLNCVYFIIFILFLQQLDGNLIGPMILGDSTGLSSFWVIFAITVFGGIWGIPGMIIGVPVFAIIYAAIKSNVNQSLVKKELSPNTDHYTNIECIDDDGIHTYDFLNNRKSNEFHSGSRFISSIEEWEYYYEQTKSSVHANTTGPVEVKQEEEKSK